MWTCSVKLDFDKPNVGTATATWNAGQADAFTYADRVKMTMANGQKFMAEAKAGLVEATAQAAREANLTTILTSMFEEAAE